MNIICADKKVDHECLATPLNAITKLKCIVRDLIWLMRCLKMNAALYTSRGAHAHTRTSSKLSSKPSSNLPYPSNRPTLPPRPAKGLGKESEWGSFKYGGDPTLMHLQTLCAWTWWGGNDP